MRKYYIIILLVCILLPLSVLAGGNGDKEYKIQYELSMAEGFYQNKDYTRAFQHWQEAADLGSAVACCKLANC